ncbi:MAG: phosphomethylpyrimidine synthase ThiC [Candidatus Omnitrophica bacterium]|nr:phosphomethylpyrimidine synthase ThiC [Candidatus Omnitrophota bacterium]
MTQLESAKKNISTFLVQEISRLEGISEKIIRQRLKTGRLAILNNNRHKVKKVCAVGKGLRVKINANIGTSSELPCLEKEIEKLDVAIKYGADTIMDLSTGGDLKDLRRAIMEKSSVPVGTVPVYEIAVRAQEKKSSLIDFDIEDILEVLKSQASDGVDFFTIHAGVTRKSLAELKKNKRVLDIVSRGGAILANWISNHKKENPFYEHYDRILDIAYEYDVVLSLGDGLRPGSILDATDKGQLAELSLLGELAIRAQKRNVQVIIEGPGHVPIEQIQRNIRLEKKLCHGAPFYVLGPLVTDVAAGYDHISSAIGGAWAGFFGADFLCFVTPSEHLRHPSVEDTREGVVAARIAAHAADLARRQPYALNWDRRMSQARKKRDWESQIALAIDPDKARLLKESSKPVEGDACTMCGRYCSIKLMEECMRE